jgi:hypothetical protein
MDEGIYIFLLCVLLSAAFGGCMGAWLGSLKERK